MLRQRVLTALVLVPIIVGVLLYAPTHVTAVLIGLVMVVGAMEWAHFVTASRMNRRLFALAIIVAMAAGWYVSAKTAGLFGVLWLAMVWWVFALVLVLRFPLRLTPGLVAAGGVLVMVPAAVALGRLATDHGGPHWVLFLFVLIWAADIGAFFVGKLAGRHKLAPRVSPGKTWEGVGGGFALALTAAAGGSMLLGAPFMPLVALCAAATAISILGDLCVSMFKRNSGVKDSSRLLPGHGGLLDRIDSLCAAAPLFLLGLLLLEIRP